MAPNLYLQKFAKNGFKPRSAASFDNEFVRLAGHMGWLSLGKAYNRHHAKAQAFEQQVLPARPQAQSYFQKFAMNGFKPRPSASFENEFVRLAGYMGWLSLGKAYNRQHVKAQAFEQQHLPARPQAQSYFSKYAAHGFVTNPKASFKDEFARLAMLMGWSENGLEYGKQRLLANQADFDSNHGSSEKLKRWQELCCDVGVVSVPGSITQCRKKLAKLYINIHDFMDWRRLPQPRAPFDKQKASLQELRKYTIKHKKVFPKVLAKKEGFIKALLRRIF